MNRLFCSAIAVSRRCHLLPESLSYIRAEYSTYNSAGFVLVHYSFLTAHRVHQVFDSLPLAHIKRGGVVWCMATLIADAPDAQQIYNLLLNDKVLTTN